jgi:uncharacterized protein (DUF1697 family)
MKYAAFLRGVNVGGNALVKMTDLKTLLEAAGFENVQTVIASGNVIFEAKSGDDLSIERKIESALKKKYKRDVAVMVRSIDELQRMERSQPFKGITATSNTRLYVTFLSDKSLGVKLPELPPDLRIVRIRDKDVFAVLEISPHMKTTDSMNIIAKLFGERITTRNWNTVQKILKAAA